MPGEFGVSADGGATYVLPLEIPPGRRGMEPHLALAYDSNSREDSTAEIGFSLQGFSKIERCGSNLRRDG